MEIPTLTLKRYQRLQKEVNRLQNEYQKSRGALEQVLERLQTEHDCKTIAQAERKLSKLQQELEKEEKAFAKELEAFEKELESYE